jgi:hypothetical protein
VGSEMCIRDRGPVVGEEWSVHLLHVFSTEHGS